MASNTGEFESFLAMFERGDVEAASAYMESHPPLAGYDGIMAHPLLREFVRRNCGHCYKSSHRAIADLLIPARIRAFRNDVMADRTDSVQSRLKTDPELVHAEFTGGRGIARAIHHWRSIPIGKLLLDGGPT